MRWRRRRSFIGRVIFRLWVTKVGDKMRAKFNRYVIFYERMEEEAD